MKRIKYLILILGIFAGFALPLIPANAGAAWDPLPCNTAEEKATAVCNDKGSNTFTNVVQTIVNTLLYILAAVCVVVIIIAGITYTTSGGDSALVAKAKNTLLYAIVGLVVAILAYPIVNYVIGVFGG